MSSAPPNPSQPPPPERRRELARACGAVAVLAVAVALAAGVGASGGPGDSIGARLAAALMLTVTGGGPALAYVLGAVGLGALGAPLWRGGSSPLALQTAFGLALTLTLSHAMGWTGALGLGPWMAAAPVVAGLVLLTRQVMRGGGFESLRIPLSPLLVAVVPAAAVLLVTSCSPPGYLWESEFGGYDALSYHLQLPREWLAAGRLSPREHNVYSFLPGYVEAAFMHLRAAMGERGPDALAAGSGASLIACQMLHAQLAAVAAVLIGCVAAAAAGLAGLGVPARRAAGLTAFAVTLATPWSIVTGSLAYNEHAMLALGAASALAAMDGGIAPSRRALLTGLLVGVACGAKATALLFIGVPVGVLLLGSSATRAWPRMIAAGSAAGLLALAPWLVRNALASGNPVFPYAAALLGRGHWTAEQVGTFRAGHHFTGSIADRVRLLVWPDAQGRARGLLHIQWGAFFPALAAAAALVLANPRTRRAGGLLCAAAGAQVVLWLAATHIQSRFLMPVLIPGAAAIGLAAAAMTRSLGRIPLATAAGAAVAGAQALVLTWMFLYQNGGRPNRMLSAGPGVFSGAAFRAAFRAASPTERADFLAGASPEVFVNLALPQTATVYLLGGATPLYFRAPVLYNTTWDRWPLAGEMRAHPDDPAAWTAALAGRGVRFVLADFGELTRLREDGWSDPLMTPQRVADWLAVSARAVREWPTGQVLFELPGVSP